MQTQLSKSNYLAASTEVKNVCQALMETTGVVWFAYARLYDNRDFEIIISDYDVLCFTLEQQGYFTQMEIKPFEVYTSCFTYDEFGAESKGELDFYSGIKEKFNLSHFLAYQDKREEYCDFFTFGAESDNKKINEFYLMNLPYLKKYSQLVKPIMRDIISKHNIPKISIPYRYDERFARNYPMETEDNLNVLADLVQENLHRKTAAGKAHLSPRELQCLRLLLENNTAKEAARKLNISHRTVEHHYNRLKLKLDMGSKKEILARFESEL